MEKKVLYSGVVLDKKSKERLLFMFNEFIPEGWKRYGHHMTINLGELSPELKNEIGKNVTLKVTEIGVSDKAIAVKVDGFISKNKIPHVTIAVNEKDGGKPMMSNFIENWKALIIPFAISGVVTEITN